MTGVAEDGAWVRLWGVMRDVTALHNAVAALSHPSRHDALTGLPNRVSFAAASAQAIAEASRLQRRFALFVIDLDHFKEINDTLGHHVGDIMLNLLGPRLVALLDPARGTIARMGGDEFVRLAEMGDLIKPFTALIIDEALAQWVRWAAQGFRPRLAVNLSPRNLVDDVIVADIVAALKRHAVPPSGVELEITEGAFMHDPDRALALLGRLRGLGITLSIDDFGTGFSSLAYLRRMPISALKIDKSFVLDVVENDADKAIVNSTINLAHNLGISVIAEGVETGAVRDILVSLGCDIGQGYWFTRPLSADDVLSWCTTFSVAAH
jgi:predicted signal transduction protein with EAL and GGDEF domain